MQDHSSLGEGTVRDQLELLLRMWRKPIERLSRRESFPEGVGGISVDKNTAFFPRFLYQCDIFVSA